MRITDRFVGEHRVFIRQLETIAELQGAGASDDALIGAVRTLAAPLLRHAGDEDRVLFPEVTKHIGEGGPIPVLVAEHVLIHDFLATIATRPPRASIARALADLTRVIREHIAKEEEVLFPLAERLIGDERLQELDDEAAREVVHV